MEVSNLHSRRVKMSPPKLFNLSKSEMDIMNKYMFEPVLASQKQDQITGSPGGESKNKLTFDYGNQKC
tara:strand:- start:1698 stop:1901 length:204 start_codon:yes stop_codon:yes gene_type:complete